MVPVQMKLFKEKLGCDLIPKIIVKDIYQCGQWAFAPAGVPTTILIGKLAADKTLKKKGKKR